ncbi:PAS domain-containing sensor histidine kinase [Arcobacter sp. LA11]|uniref:PAS domain-containing sensor histidine kinase n=1 Tax=Arcobacter sp. LA11 TaxID=1898176 RepID=UPI0009330173|nr:PAS domain-containing sensor histidine kinase [Arcobacter sp. LA11]
MTEFNKDVFEQVLQASFSFSNQAIYWLSKEGKLLYANNNALDGLGYTLEELQELYVWDVDYNVNTKEKYLEAVESFALNNNDPLLNILETHHKRKNGEKFPVEVVSKVVNIDKEEVLISYAKDITNRLKRTEDIKFYFELINSSEDMIFLIEHETELVEFANKTACKNLGYSLSELKKMKVSDFREPFEKMGNLELPEIFKKIQESNNLTTFGIFNTKDGKKIPVETSLHLKSYHGENFVTAISRDISERLDIETKKEELNKKLTDYNKTLQKEISKAKQELIEYENIMKRQSKMAAMGEMLENIAHQWRQPLSAVSVLSTGMILQNEQNMLTKDFINAGLNDINDNVQYLSKTIDDFRNFFKPNKQKNHFNLEQLINTSIKLSKARYSGEIIDYILEIEDLELYTYENELLQVLLNLISNSKDELIKKDYRKCIFIKTMKNGNSIVINIKDNGGGIDKYIMDRIFEPYFTTKHSYQGTGIGLFMSENIIKHMSGSISVENEDIEYNGKQYKGASFNIKLPI